MTNPNVSEFVTKPAEGSVAPVEVKAWWKHPLVLITSFAATVPLILSTLIELKQLPNLPTNLTSWLGTAIAILTAVLTILRALGLLGAPVITPTAASKLIQSDPNQP